MVARIVARKYPQAKPLIDFIVSNDGSGSRITYWSASLGTQPTAEQLTAWRQDALFLAWLAEHGGDALLTIRREAKEHLDAAQKEAAILRAVIVLTVQEINALREWITDFKAATAAATSLANLQTRVAALPAVPQRTNEAVRTAIKAAVTAGEAGA